jgi:hypothetical protein
VLQAASYADRRSRCEVQFDYGLRQMRHLPVSKRPELFTSATGKEISVEKAVAASNEVILEKGRVRICPYPSFKSLMSLTSPCTKYWRKRSNLKKSEWTLLPTKNAGPCGVGGSHGRSRTNELNDAFRLVNMISALTSLQALGKAVCLCPVITSNGLNIFYSARDARVRLCGEPAGRRHHC